MIKKIMHKSFLISEDERKRILGIHEEATKRQYLNEVDNNPPKEWSSYPCVPKHKDARKGQLKNGMVVYSIGNIAYYPDGNRSKKPGETEQFYKFYCTDDEFKINPEEVNKEWEKYPCLTNNKRASKQTNEDGTFFYQFKGEAYFANGRKTSGDTITYFNCESPEFKASDNEKPSVTPKKCANSADEILAKKALLKRGCQGDLVKQVQNALVSKGKLTQDQVTGSYDNNTYKAVYSFQKDDKTLSKDGVVGKNTWDKLVGSTKETEVVTNDGSKSFDFTPSKRQDLLSRSLEDITKKSNVFNPNFLGQNFKLKSGFDKLAVTGNENVPDETKTSKGMKPF